MNRKSIVSRQFDGKLRRLFAHNCEVCEKEFWLPKHRAESRFCSKPCYAKRRLKRTMQPCATCGSPVWRSPSKSKNAKHGYWFCNRRCKEQAQEIGGIEELSLPHYGDGSLSYRERAFRKLGAFCARCGYNEHKRMLDVDHINGRRGPGSHTIQNLQILCVWCHALKTRRVSEQNGLVHKDAAVPCKKR